MQNTLTHEIIILHIAYLQMYVVPKVFFFHFHEDLQLPLSVL